MREIKFRAFIGGDMIPSSALAFEEYGTIEDQLGSVVNLMQYTGLKDKNNVDIYEGDVLRTNDTAAYDSMNKIFKVFWFEENCSFYGQANWTPKNERDTRKYVIEMLPNLCEVEVIGNIYENPELIK